ncbi:hypothetical protein B0T26DRAFT_711892 [Lasiosphaeria miniovina]|uniref:CCHC-type domain-containing protein n=1 Tax=Lasiosphaeria miniovina TaxID=1954250 RepID=A0AA40ALN4_9PEZI|nr:uncharacterized protein B0T26DRAFT_711892 [Lasiosphaeria miniovina]KAK0718109.1 hypothetical protein B0T26DRAFT_711892 [Lasiosphaeria miniovina]
MIFIPPQDDTHISDKCHNYGQSGHLQKQCCQELKCQNCGGSFHTPNTCPQPKVPRCFICKSAEHTRNECPNCEICHEEGHRKSECVSGTKCNHCQQPGHKAKNCPNRSITYRNCGKEGHLVASCNHCNHCNTNGHTTRRCPDQQTCKICQQSGHMKSGCPSRKCTFCSNLGHSQGECPEQRIDDEITYIPTNMSFQPSARVKQNLNKQDPAAEPSARAGLIADMNMTVSEADRPKGFAPVLPDNSTTDVENSNGNAGGGWDGNAGSGTLDQGNEEIGSNSDSHWENTASNGSLDAGDLGQDGSW